MEIPEEFIYKQQGGKDAILYAGLIHLATARGIQAIETTLVVVASAENAQTWCFKARVTYKDGTIFEGHGDANPGNVRKGVAIHACRMAETRAKARALRDSLDIAYVCAEELGDDDPLPTPHRSPSSPPAPVQQQRQYPAPAPQPGGGTLYRAMSADAVVRTSPADDAAPASLALYGRLNDAMATLKQVGVAYTVAPNLTVLECERELQIMIGLYRERIAAHPELAPPRHPAASHS